MAKEATTSRAYWKSQGYAYFRPATSDTGPINPEVLARELREFDHDRIVLDLARINLFASRAFYELVRWREEVRKEGRPVEVILANLTAQQQESLSNMGWVGYRQELNFETTKLSP